MTFKEQCRFLYIFSACYFFDVHELQSLSLPWSLSVSFTLHILAL